MYANWVPNEIWYLGLAQRNQEDVIDPLEDIVF